jgi:predicted regulator of Ras-like GTPase activity (Roadblock/LC7/MglB family)
MTVAALLSTLRDVEGVIGSFVVDRYGQVCARDMPAMFDQQALEDAAPRIARLKEALETQGELLDSATLAHGPHVLFLRASADHILCVLSPVEVKLPSLRMGTNLVLRRLPEVIAREATVTPRHATYPPPMTTSSAPPPDAAPAAPPGPAPAPTKRPRFFRGRRIDD